MAKGTTNKPRFCYCCHKDKPETEFYIHRGTKKLIEFCVDCYDTKTAQERKTQQLKYVLGIIRKMKVDNDD